MNRQEIDDLFEKYLVEALAKYVLLGPGKSNSPIKNIEDCTKALQEILGTASEIFFKGKDGRKLDKQIAISNNCKL